MSVVWSQKYSGGLAPSYDSGEKQKFLFKSLLHDCLRFYPQNYSVLTYNVRKLESLHRPTAKIPADNNNPEATKEDSRTAEGLEEILHLCTASRVMSKTNSYKGLVNGALGTVVTDNIYHPGKVPPSDRSLVICVQFDNYTGPVVNNAVPIPAMPSSWK
ncbi:hypothetical protein AVEN_30772-1 [Araneus ventricosus]|uniref:Uncharacterized protein n=1 Tax=Araneus ventricosus TaxID=182803 RepID=A0A4Y2V199_ARAVE|nr:hypothetical protein AVEN_30772-1 [Araneus ventricosus]